MRVLRGLKFLLATVIATFLLFSCTWASGEEKLAPVPNFLTDKLLSGAASFLKVPLEADEMGIDARGVLVLKSARVPKGCLGMDLPALHSQRIELSLSGDFLFGGEISISGLKASEVIPETSPKGSDRGFDIDYNSNGSSRVLSLKGKSIFISMDFSTPGLSAYEIEMKSDPLAQPSGRILAAAAAGKLKGGKGPAETLGSLIGPGIEKWLSPGKIRGKGRFTVKNGASSKEKKAEMEGSFDAATSGAGVSLDGLKISGLGFAVKGSVKGGSLTVKIDRLSFSAKGKSGSPLKISNADGNFDGSKFVISKAGVDFPAPDFGIQGSLKGTAAGTLRLSRKGPVTWNLNLTVPTAMADPGFLTASLGMPKSRESGLPGVKIAPITAAVSGVGSDYGVEGLTAGIFGGTVAFSGSNPRLTKASPGQGGRTNKSETGGGLLDDLPGYGSAAEGRGKKRVELTSSKSGAGLKGTGDFQMRAQNLDAGALMRLLGTNWRGTVTGRISAEASLDAFPPQEVPKRINLSAEGLTLKDFEPITSNVMVSSQATSKLGLVAILLGDKEASSKVRTLEEDIEKLAKASNYIRCSNFSLLLRTDGKTTRVFSRGGGTASIRGTLRDGTAFTLEGPGIFMAMGSGEIGGAAIFKSPLVPMGLKTHTMTLGGTLAFPRAEHDYSPYVSAVAGSSLGNLFR